MKDEVQIEVLILRSVTRIQECDLTHTVRWNVPYFRSHERKRPREVIRSFEAFPCDYRHVSYSRLVMYCVCALR